MASPSLSPAAIRLHSKHGDHDCAIASLASYLRVDYEEVLIAADRTERRVWRSGLSGPAMVRVAKRLGFSVKWKVLDKEDLDALDDLTGILDLRFWNKADQAHVTLIIDGAIYEADDDPVTRWDPTTYCRFYNAYPIGLLEMVE